MFYIHRIHIHILIHTIYIIHIPYSLSCLGILNTLHISDVSCLTLFAWFALSTGGAILFYHHLQVLFHPFFICIGVNFPKKLRFCCSSANSCDFLFTHNLSITVMRQLCSFHVVHLNFFTQQKHQFSCNFLLLLLSRNNDSAHAKLPPCILIAISR